MESFSSLFIPGDRFSGFYHLPCLELHRDLSQYHVIPPPKQNKTFKTIKAVGLISINPHILVVLSENCKLGGFSLKETCRIM